MTLYLKYRPQRFSELDLIGVRESLIKIMAAKSPPHALLFYGPKGTGKTSAARILAKSLNCESESKKLRGEELIEPCNECNQCISITKGNNIDVIELDAASNRGIDDIRNLREAVKLAPTRARKKVYIIDEAHMLTLEASNALLKTLEEPPSHVVFILATTNPEKLIPTIRSRTVNLNFNKATIEEVVASLHKVAEGEGIKLVDDALEIIARHSDGAFRDAKKTMEYLIAQGINFSVEEVKKTLEGSSGFDPNIFFTMIAEGKIDEMIQYLKKAVESGMSAKNITNSLINTLRESLYGKLGLEGKQLEKLNVDETILLIDQLTQSLHDITVSPKEEIPLETVLIKWVYERTKDISEKGGGNKGENDSNKDEKTKTIPRPQNKNSERKEIEVNYESGDSAGVNDSDKQDGVMYQGTVTDNMSQISKELWDKILNLIRGKNTSTEALLRAAKPISFDGKRFTLGVFYSFHKEKLEINPHRLLLEDIISGIVGNPIRICCVLTKPPEKDKNEEKPNQENDNRESDVILSEDNDDNIIKLAEEIFS